MRQLGEFLLDSWTCGIKIKKSTNNHISILREALVDLHSPPGAHYRLNHLQPCLSVHYTEKQQSWGGPRYEEPGEPRHGCSYSEHLAHIGHLNVRICINTFSLCKTTVTSNLRHQTWQQSEFNSEKVVPHRQHSTAPVTKDKSHKMSHLNQTS